MTLIALTNNFNKPVLIGDILLTSKEPHNQVQIPAFLSVMDNFIPSISNFPFSLKQKLYIIQDYLALSMAGNVYQMTLFLEDIKNYFKYYPVNNENYKNFISSFDLETISECSILICIQEHIDGVHTFNHYQTGYWRETSSSLVKHAIASGSGARSFMNKIDSFNGLDGSVYNSRSINLILLSNLIADERLTLNSILEAWGAGFELIECQDGIFKKLDDLTFMVWYGKLNSTQDDLSGEPLLILHYRYHNDALIIRSYTQGNVGGYVVLPLDVKKEDIIEEDYPNNADFISTQVVCTFALEAQDGKVYFPTWHTQDGDGVEAIKVQVHPDSSIDVDVRQDKRDELVLFLTSKI